MHKLLFACSVSGTELDTVRQLPVVMCMLALEEVDLSSYKKYSNK